ncbi:MAG: thermonuclease family protein [Nitrososphaeraceae archaeon]
MKKLVFVCIALLSVINLGIANDERVCTVTKVIDGDTIHATCSGQPTKIRLTTIDSYESRRNNRAYRQAYEQHISVDEVVKRGKQATEYTKKLLSNKQIIIKHTSPDTQDRYGRELGEVYIKDNNINQLLLKQHPDVFLKY